MKQERDTFLEKMLQHKRQEIAAFKKKHSLADLRTEVSSTVWKPRSFKQALERTIRDGQTAIIAEIKQASPSGGVLRPDFNAVELAKNFETQGATCISVLTDERFFGGKPEDLSAVKAAVRLPILRKDFILDPIQVWESKKMGADAILLIMAALGFTLCKELMAIAKQLSLGVLLEVHTEAELERALHLDEVAILGINNRNLNTLEISLKTTTELVPRIPKGRLVVSESGIASRSDLTLLQRAGVCAFLVGEALIRAENPGNKLTELLGKR